MLSIGTRPGQWGPFVSTPPLTEIHGNRVGMWFDSTPVGFTVQITLLQRSVVVGYLYKVARPTIKARSAGWARVHYKVLIQLDEDED